MLAKNLRIEKYLPPVFKSGRGGGYFTCISVFCAPMSSFRGSSSLSSLTFMVEELVMDIIGSCVVV